MLYFPAWPSLTQELRQAELGISAHMQMRTCEPRSRTWAVQNKADGPSRWGEQEGLTLCPLPSWCSESGEASGPGILPPPGPWAQFWLCSPRSGPAGSGRNQRGGVRVHCCPAHGSLMNRFAASARSPEELSVCAQRVCFVTQTAAVPNLDFLTT